MFKILRRTKDGHLISPFTIDEYAVSYTPHKRTRPIMGKLFVFRDIEWAIDTLEMMADPTLELWECDIGNPIRWLSAPYFPGHYRQYWSEVERIGKDDDTQPYDDTIPYYDTISYHDTIVTPCSTYACEWVELTIQLHKK